MKHRNIRGQITSRYTAVWESNNVAFLGNAIEYNLCIKYLFKKEQKIKHTSKGT